MAKEKAGGKDIIARITPVWIPAILNESGFLFPDPEGNVPWIPREYLDPVEQNANNTVIGTVNDLDDYVVQNRGFVDFETLARHIFICDRDGRACDKWQLN